MATKTFKKTVSRKPVKAKQPSLAERLKEIGNWKKESGVVIKMPKNFNKPMNLTWDL